MSEINTGTLVTSAEAPEGSPRWVARVEVAYQDGKVVLGLIGGDRGVEAPDRVRGISDREAVVLVEALTWETWERFRDGSHLLAGSMYLRETGGSRRFWSMGSGVPAYLAQGFAATRHERRVAASRAFLAHICTRTK